MLYKEKMESINATECLIHCAVGIKDFDQSPQKEALEKRLENMDEIHGITKKLKQPTRNIYVLGQDKATESIKELTNDLLSREYLNVAKFDGIDDADVGVIVIPESHVPKKPRILDRQHSKLILDNNPDDKQLQVSPAHYSNKVGMINFQFN